MRPALKPNLSILHMIRFTFWGLAASLILTATNLSATETESVNTTTPLSPQDRHKASIIIAENAQDADILRQLLQGRQLIFFGQLGGEYAHYDIPSFMDQDGFEIRNFRLGLAGLSPWFKNFSYKLEVDLADGSSTISDAYIHYRLSDKGSLTIGNQDGSQSLSGATGSLSLLFMEAPLPSDGFSLDKRVGISYDRNWPKSGLHLLVFGRDLNSDANHKGAAARAFFNPHRSAQGIWHLGANYVWQKNKGTARLKTRPESHVTDIRLVDTGEHNDVVSDHRYGIEIAGARGAFTTRIELFLNTWKREDGSHNDFAGAYLEGGYFLTGQPFNYINGKFVRPHLDGGRAAWELAYRVSWLDLNDGDVRGGEETNAGLALNYYPRPNLRGQFNLIHVSSDRPDSDGWLVQVRLQFNW